ncbi:MAG: hypothetical protein QM774_14285 [Gordonia sp. (in: high G+C Gram-positive bacteria)]|uniref:hypothetical protein n=1 Tax=Gordonia sp. (in: high G+C Gram-positive bacteria) TaxID=84139 RepID=UPI0039E4E340
MSTNDPNTPAPGKSGGTDFWKILAIVLLLLVALPIAWSLLKAAGWLILFVLVIVGAVVTGRAIFSK